MALQYTKTVSWNGEDLGFGGQRITRKSFAATAQGTQPPVVVTPSFLQSTTLPTQLLGGLFSFTQFGLNRLIVNRSPRFFMTLVCQVSDSLAKPAHFVIPPLQTLFLPQNCTSASATMYADSTFPYPLPPGANAASIPKAGSVTSLTFDFVRES